MNRPWLWPLAALTCVVAAYSTVLDVGFLWDDIPLIRDNVDVHHLQAPWASLGRGLWQHRFFSAAGAQPYYRPLISASYAVEWALGGGHPALFHASNLLVHLGVCWLLFLLCRRAGAPALQASLAAAAFGVATPLTECVTWISGRTDLWATAAVLAALLAWRDEGAPRRRALGSALLLLLGLLSKESAIAGVVVVGLDAVLRSSRADALRSAAAMGAVVLGYTLLRHAAIGATPVEPRSLSLSLASLGELTFTALTPWRARPQVGFFSDAEPWAVALGAVALVAGLAALWRGRRHAAFPSGAGAAVAVLLVSLVRAPAFTLTANRFLYLPLALGLVAASHWRWPRWLLAGVALGSAGLGVATLQTNALWADDLRLWLAIEADAHPLNPGPSLEVGNALAERARHQEALAHYERSAALWGEVLESPPRLALAVTLSHLGRDAEALAQLEVLRRRSATWRRAWYDWPLFEARAERLAQARAALSTVRQRFGPDEALDALERRIESSAVALSSQETPRHARAFAYATLGATARAEGLYTGLLDDEDHRVDAATWLVVHGSEAVATAAARSLGTDEAMALLRARWSDR
ncbi:MAG: hypothetical protein JNG84_08440 [Archangium sp.]|nr:hypothetical protein [Archangium sp.]